MEAFIARNNRLKTTMEAFKGKFLRLAELSDLLILNAKETNVLTESAKSQLDTSPKEAARLFGCANTATSESRVILEEYQRLWKDLVDPEAPWADIPGDD